MHFNTSPQTSNNNERDAAIQINVVASIGTPVMEKAAQIRVVELNGSRITMTDSGDGAG